MIVIVGPTDKEAQAQLDEYLKYADSEGVLALFGGWTGINLSPCADDEDLRLSDSPIVQSLVQSFVYRWDATVPGTDSLPWTKARIVEHMSIGGSQTKVVGSATTVAHELERWLDNNGVDGFNLAHITNPGSFEDIIEYLFLSYNTEVYSGPRSKRRAQQQEEP